MRLPRRRRAHGSTGARKPVLFLDVDGVISLFGFPSSLEQAPGDFHWIDGIAHCIPPGTGERLVRLAERFELVWATGWQQRVNEHLPLVLGLPFADLPCLDFGGRAVFGSSDWKIDAVDAYAGDRSVAWIDDNHGDANRLWALERDAPTLLVETSCEVGMTDRHVDELLRWAEAAAIAGGPARLP